MGGSTCTVRTRFSNLKNGLLSTLFSYYIISWVTLPIHTKFEPRERCPSVKFRFLCLKMSDSVAQAHIYSSDTLLWLLPKSLNSTALVIVAIDSIESSYPRKGQSVPQDHIRETRRGTKEFGRGRIPRNGTPPAPILGVAYLDCTVQDKNRQHGVNSQNLVAIAWTSSYLLQNRSLKIGLWNARSVNEVSSVCAAALHTQLNIFYYHRSVASKQTKTHVWLVI